MTVFEMYFTDPLTFQSIFAVSFPFLLFGEYHLASFWIVFTVLNGLSGYQISIDQQGILFLVVWLYREMTALADWSAKSPFKEA